jgi:hypothetical protein
MDRICESMAGNAAKDNMVASAASNPKGNILTHTYLIKLWNKFVCMKNARKEIGKLHNYFLHKYKEFLLHHQEHGHPRKNMREDTAL